ncbi:MAG: hypothetical protein IT285_04635 [Bdellovibrionales bacterium]|nr:hypothetical protein [Bdellovibrionales bacterium]
MKISSFFISSELKPQGTVDLDVAAWLAGPPPAEPAPTERDVLASLLLQPEEMASPSALTSGQGSDLRRALETNFPASQPPPAASIIQLVAAHPDSAHSPGLAAHLPDVAALCRRITDELRAGLACLLSLNPSRRDALSRHLDALAGIPPQPHPTGDRGYEAGGLRRWVEQTRTAPQERALDTFVEEVALTCLGQAMLLKSWSDRGVRPWTRTDLGRLNWTLSASLKPFVPLHRECWQLTRPNLYSWYNPPATLQEEIWETLRRWDLSDAVPSLLTGLLRAGRRHAPALPEIRGYDLRFYCSVWEKLGHFAQRSDSAALVPERHAFSPTLRDGAFVRTGPAELQWHGTEAYPFQLLAAEMAELWKGPKVPPLWMTGTGLDAHSREQLALRLGAPKPSPVARIAERENCELGFVLEERPVRASERGADSAALREELDRLPYFKPLRSDRVSLGSLQACVTLTKLRPGGLLWWAREAPLTRDDGQEILRFLLDRSTLLCEWDLSAATHTLPVKIPLFPRYLYAFRREPRTDLRRAHRPQRVRVEGEIRSHAEVPRLLEEAFSAYRPDSRVTAGERAGLAFLLEPREGAQPPRPGTRSSVGQGQWRIHHQVAPQAQQEWSEHWPDAASQDTLVRLEGLRGRSVPLGQLIAVRPVTTKESQSLQERGWSRAGMTKQTVVLCSGKGAASERELRAVPADAAAADLKGEFLLMCPDASWVAPIAAFLESAPVREWFDHFCERRKGQWLLSEQTVKVIPLPRALVDALQGTDASIPAEWERRAEQIPFSPGEAAAALDSSTAGPVRARVFTRAARALAELKASQARLLGMVAADGRIHWREFMRILPRSEKVSFQLHPSLRMSGSLPPHLPIEEIQPLKRPARGVLLATEGGLNLCVTSEDAFLMELLCGQLEGLEHPTWNELTRVVELPRQADVAQSTANDILRSHQEQLQRIRELQDLTSAAAAF